MKNCKTACYAFCAREACTLSEIKNLNDEAVHLPAAAMIFEELGV